MEVQNLDQQAVAAQKAVQRLIQTRRGDEITKKALEDIIAVNGLVTGVLEAEKSSHASCAPVLSDEIQTEIQLLLEKLESKDSFSVEMLGKLRGALRATRSAIIRNLPDNLSGDLIEVLPLRHLNLLSCVGVYNMEDLLNLTPATLYSIVQLDGHPKTCYRKLLKALKDIRVEHNFPDYDEAKPTE